MSRAPCSIIIPAYNYGHWLEAAVRSACAQDDGSFELEVLVVDDASTDDTPQIMQAFAHDPRVRYIRQPANLGAFKNFDSGVTHAKGEYLCVLSADNLYMPGFLSAAYRFLEEHPEVQVVSTSHSWMSADGESQWKRDEPIPGNHSGSIHDFARMLAGSFQPVSETLLVPRWVFERFGAYTDNGLQIADYDMVLRWARSGIRFGYLDYPYLAFRLHDSQASGPEYAASGRSMFDYLDIFEKHVSDDTAKALRGYEYSIARNIRHQYDRACAIGLKYDAEIEKRVVSMEQALASMAARGLQEREEPYFTVILDCASWASSIFPIGATLAELVKQTYQKWELIIVRARGSALDESAVRELMKRNVRVLRFSNDITPDVAINSAIELAHGNCLSFIRVGNVYPPEYLEIVARNFMLSDAEVIYSSVDCYVSDENTRDHAKDVFAYSTEPSRLTVAPIGPIDAMAVRRSVIDRVGKLPSNVPCLHEWEWQLRLSSNARNILLPWNTVVVNRDLRVGHELVCDLSVLESSAVIYERLQTVGRYRLAREEHMRQLRDVVSTFHRTRKAHEYIEFLRAVYSSDVTVEAPVH